MNVQELNVQGSNHYLQSKPNLTVKKFKHNQNMIQESMAKQRHQIDKTAKVN